MKLNLMAVVLAILALSVSGWGACTIKSEDAYYGPIETGGCIKGTVTSTNEPWVHYIDRCFAHVCWINYAGNSLFDCGSTCPNGWTTVGDYCYIENVLCDTKYESDSLVCVLGGNIWQDGTCKENHCKAADTTWLSTSIASCTGENNYAIENTDTECLHTGICCNQDSLLVTDHCIWKCDSLNTICLNKKGTLKGTILLDTTVIEGDSVFTNKCYYNCLHSPNVDSTVYLVEGNIIVLTPNDSISNGTKSYSDFNSIRTLTNNEYNYNFISPIAYEYIDSVSTISCVNHMWRCVKNKKYIYWYDNQSVPDSCINIVRVK